MAEKSDPVDVSQLAKRDLSETAFPGGSKQDFRVFFDRAIHERIASHAQERLSLEICGVLIGHWRRDADGPFVLVDESIRCDKAVSNAGDVTFTHEAWNDVHHQMDTRFTDRDIVGWYHSHPNFGIFLSDRDCFIHEHFFNGPGQIAYVVDPVNGVEGVFNWKEGKATLCPHFWVGKKIHLSSQGGGRKPSSAPPAGQLAASVPKAEPSPPMSSSMNLVLAAVCFLLLGYLLGSKLTEADRIRTELGAVAHYGLFKGLRPGMREQIDLVNDNLQKIAQATTVLAKEHISLAGDAAEDKKKQWSEILQALQMTDNALRQIKSVYSLTPEESAEVQQLINAKEAEEENLRIQTAKDSTAKDSAAKTSGEKPASDPPKTSALPAKAPDFKPLDNKLPVSTTTAAGANRPESAKSAGSPADSNKKP